jgi:hypothetical protein
MPVTLTLIVSGGDKKGLAFTLTGKTKHISDITNNIGISGSSDSIVFSLIVGNITYFLFPVKQKNGENEGFVCI